MELWIRGNDGSLHINALERNFPESWDEHDGNSLRCRVVITVPGFAADFLADLSTTDFDRFQRELQNLSSNLGQAAKAEFTTMDAGLEFAVEMNRMGHVTVTGDAQHPAPPYGSTLHFVIEGDQTCLDEALLGLQHILGCFPIRGRQTNG